MNTFEDYPSYPALLFRRRVVVYSLEQIGLNIPGIRNFSIAG